MIRIDLTVSYVDQRPSVDAKAGPATQVAFEREHNCGIAAIANDMRMEHIYWLAWHATKPGVGFDDWLETVETVEIEVDAAVPTQPAAPAD